MTAALIALCAVLASALIREGYANIQANRRITSQRRRIDHDAALIANLTRSCTTRRRARRRSLETMGEARQKWARRWEGMKYTQWRVRYAALLAANPQIDPEDGWGGKYDRRHAPRRRRGRRRLPHRHATGAEVRTTGRPAGIASITGICAFAGITASNAATTSISPRSTRGASTVLPDHHITRPTYRGTANGAQNTATAQEEYVAAQPTTPSSWTQIRSRRVSKATAWLAAMGMLK